MNEELKKEMDDAQSELLSINKDLQERLKNVSMVSIDNKLLQEAGALQKEWLIAAEKHMKAYKAYHNL